MKTNTRANYKISCIGGCHPKGCFPQPGGEQSIQMKERLEATVMKDRKRQRQNRKLKHHEEALDKRSSTGYKDLTPYNAVLKMKTDGKAQIALK